jgi:ABC-type transporter Mla maintaining outer membrane lipid asymmetry ATPase subunit MlaF
VPGEPILQFEAVRLAVEELYAPTPVELSFTLMAGQLALVRLPSGWLDAPVADTAQGLIPPASGIVRFLGQDWNDMPGSRADALRGRIGRVGPDFGWLANLDVIENVTLSQRHNTRRPEPEINAEARRWAQSFGLPQGIPPGRPSGATHDVLRRAACARAFIGDPAFIVLDRLTESGHASMLEFLISSCTFVRGRGTAILWIAEYLNDETRSKLDPTVDLSLTEAKTFAH